MVQNKMLKATMFYNKTTLKKENKNNKFFINYFTKTDNAFIWQTKWDNLHLYYKSLIIHRCVQKFFLLNGIYTNKFYLRLNHNTLRILSSSFGVFKNYKTKKTTEIYIKQRFKDRKNKQIKIALFILDYFKVSQVKVSFYSTYLPRKIVNLNALKIFRKYNQERFFWESLQIVNAVFKGYASASILASLIYNHTRRNPKRLAFVIYIKRLLGWHYTSYKKLAIYGIRIEVKGRFNPKSRSKKHIISCGRVYKHSQAHNVDYAFKETVTKFGCLGIKVWVCPVEKIKIKNASYTEKNKAQKNTKKSN